MYIQMFDLKKTAEELEVMLHEILVKQGIFTSIGKNTYRYKNYLIAKNDDHWLIFFIEKKKNHIATTFLKVSAFAVCKIHEKRLLNTVDDLLKLDQLFEKNYIDSLFYKKTMLKSQDPVSKDTAMWRYEIAHSTAKECKAKIDGMFYSSLA